jgi:2',3'-cyclic-nucleotide 2'-phosphodiesterase
MPSNKGFTILALGDVVGKPGRRALASHLPNLIAELGAQFVVVNAENASGGLGIKPQEANELLELPIDVLTSGNHIWRHREIIPFLNAQPRLLRPANYPENTPGRGQGVFVSKSGVAVGVLNLEGTLFMSPLPCPFRCADRELSILRERTAIILVDFHAEATSEKRALGHYLDGRVSVIVGTHTHIPTADAEVLAGGSGYQTDLGMCGPTDSVIGVGKREAIERFLTKVPTGFQVAREGVRLQGAVIRINPDSGKCLEITQRSWSVDV